MGLRSSSDMRERLLPMRGGSWMYSVWLPWRGIGVSATH